MRKKPKKPRAFLERWSSARIDGAFNRKQVALAHVEGKALYSEEARRLGEWLIAFADWFDAKLREHGGKQ